MGSSPHTRGAPGVAAADICEGGIIPAYAGSTRCGRGGGPGAVGSSPHTRGARYPKGRPSRRPRIIPAYAGSTRKAAMRRLPAADHPRIRGEHAGDDDATTELKGSSPHTRGARLGRPGPGLRRRIIPAYAGSTIDDLEGEDLLEDHPRIRGEHRRVVETAIASDGSSPHTRGALQEDFAGVAECRIIPAYAGSTHTSVSWSSSRQDHPRIRGEHWSRGGVRMPCLGSSPHTRGAPDREHSKLWIRGIIPAYAGSTARCPSLGCRRPGSSPHTRGARPYRRRRGRRRRIIPAYAGSTDMHGGYA